jgi:hypothetical protein
MLGIAPDHDLRELSMDLVGIGRTAVANVAGGSPLFVVIPRLPVGTYQAHIHEIPRSGMPADQDLVIRIRDPYIALDSAGPVRMWVDPHTGRLDHLWSGASAICLAGPRAHVQLTLQLAERSGGQPSAEARVQAKVPMTAAEWQSLFHEQLLSQESLVGAYDQARWCIVEVDAGRFGRYKQEFERSLPPLRWRLSEDRLGYQLLLQDDTEASSLAEVQYASYSRPCQMEALPPGFASLPTLAAEDGGLYTARLEGHATTLVVPRRRRVLKGFAELGCDPEVPPAAATVAEATARVRAVGLWGSARLPGDPVARYWRGDVVRRLHVDLMGTMCGRAWRQGESAHFRAPSPFSLAGLKTLLLSNSKHSQDKARQIADNAAKIAALPTSERITILAALLDGGISPHEQSWAAVIQSQGERAPRWASEFYLRLATDAALAEWAGDALREGIALAIAWPLPLRAARYLALAEMTSADGLTLFPPLFEHWDWP